MHMKTIRLLMLSVVLINLSACSSMSGNVIPPSGPTMETVYENMGKVSKNHQKDQTAEEEDENKELTDQDQQKMIKAFRQNNVESGLKAHGVYGLKDFHRLPNPELTLYLYPHFAGKEQLPVPGYFTVFNVYPQSYYVLLSDTER
jgi:conjugative transfer region lipoprotein (TIGR03751 family)